MVAGLFGLIPPSLSQKVEHPSGAFTFRVPEQWRVVPSKSRADALDLVGDEMLVRLVYHSGDVGYDSFHATCMMERLQEDADLDVHYEYDYVGGGYGERRALDSAFVVKYETPFEGHKKWRQRNLTIVGKGHSLCLVANVPVKVWNKSSKARAILDAVLMNVTFRE